MPGYGRQLLGTTGSDLAVIATDYHDTRWKVGGITLDWDKVVAVAGADLVLPDGHTIKVGQKYLRYGQILTRINTAEVQTATLTGGPTGGTWIATLPASGNEPAQSTSALAHNASAATVEAALMALSRIGPGGVAVTRSGAGTSGDPYVYSITFNRRAGDLPQLTSTNTFTGGTAPTVTHATGTAGTGTGMYGPYDPAATDGRQSLVRGECFILNETVTQYPPLGLGAPTSDHPAVFDGGTVWKERLLVTTSASGSLALGPTLTNFEAAFPAITYVTN
jgi:hypothetical protein